MNWEMIGALGEIAGAIGVIIALGYGGFQLRATVRQRQFRAALEVSDRISDFLQDLFQSPDLVDIWLRGMKAPDSLDDHEQFRLATMFLYLTLHWERSYYLLKDDGLEAHVATPLASGRSEVVGSRGYRAWFDTREHWFTREFRAVIRHEQSEPPEYRLPFKQTAPDDFE